MHSRCRKLSLIEFLIDRRRSLDQIDQARSANDIAMLSYTGYTKMYLTASSQY
jgi:hypothetical protein